MDHSWGYGSERRLRNENQDCYGVFEFPDFTLAIVCDGMGGHVGGAQASSLAVRSIHDALRDMDLSDIPTALEHALQVANQAIYEAARKNHRLMGMGTTAVVAAITDEVAWFAHVGDSRAYLVRNGNVRQMTRDHTMVNLFVDAELLTPEDAATHPEAHVLSRSLGVERQVDVEVSEPVELEPEDLVFLCSDGVHGVITDWEVANVDWGAPHEGIRHILDIVISREGDDNATAVAVLAATSFEDVPPTPVPEPKRFEESVAEAGLSSGVTAVPLDEETASSLYVEDDPQPLPPIGELGPRPEDDGQSYVVFEDDKPKPDSEPQAAPDLRKRNESKASNGGPSRNVLIGVAVATLVCAGLGGGAAIVVSPGEAQSSASNGSSVSIEPADGSAQGADGTEQPVAMVTMSGDPSLHTDATTGGGVEEPEPEEEGPQPLYAPELPDPPRRVPPRPTRYTQPPPGGPIQWKAVQAARNHECRQALDAVAEGMANNILDHATLYSQAWYCFTDNHQRPLAETGIETWEEFGQVLTHLEGPPEEREALDPEIEKLPAWYQPAVGGLEYRLEFYQNSSREDRLADVVSDLLGDPSVADHLANDVLIEALLADGLSRVEEPNERVESWWARRVYVVSSAMNGRIGRLLETHRPEVADQIRQLLENATTPREVELSEEEIAAGAEAPDPIPVPELVLEAHQVGLGLAPAPTAKKKVVRPRPVAPQEPDLDDLQDLAMPKVYKKN